MFRADDGGAEFAFHCGALPLGPQAGHGIDGRQELDGLVADEAQKALLRRGEKLLRGRVGFGSDDLDGDDEVSLGEGMVGVEILAVKARSCIEHVGREVGGGEGEGKCERCRQARAEVARSEEGDGHIAVMAGNGFDGLAGLVEPIGAQLFERFGKVVAGLGEAAAEGAHGEEVAAGGAAEAEVDAAGIQSFEGAELFGDNQGCVIGEHDAAAAYTDDMGGSCDVADED